VWHFVTKCTAVKFVKSWISSRFSPESRDPSYVGSATCPECPKKDWRGKSGCLHPRESGPEVVQGPGGVITFPTLHGWGDCSWPWVQVILGLQPRDPPQQAWKGMNKWEGRRHLSEHGCWRCVKNSNFKDQKLTSVIVQTKQRPSWNCPRQLQPTHRQLIILKDIYIYK